MTKAGYEYLLAYKITVPIYDYAVGFANKWINKLSRTHDQWVQAARSGTQNRAIGEIGENNKFITWQPAESPAPQAFPVRRWIRARALSLFPRQLSPQSPKIRQKARPRF